MNIAIITGASSGMGKEYAIQLEKNYSVDEIWVIARRKEKLEALKEVIKTPLRIVCLDLTKEESYKEFKELLEKEQPNITLLVNNAGLGRFGAYENTTLEDDIQMLDLNNKSLVVMTRLSLPYMKEGSNIINMASMSSYQPVPYITTYGATKAFTLSYSRALNVELKHRDIHVLAVTPYWVKTEFFNAANEKNDKKVKNFNYYYTAEQVVKQAYKDLKKRKKDISVCGKYPRFQKRLVKCLPHKLVMKIWCNQQKKAKNFDEVTK